MTKQEMIQAVAVIVSAYPAHDKFKDDTSIEAMVNVWYDFFKDDDAKLVGSAVRKHISENKWPPSIAEIREQMAFIMHPELLPPDIAWGMVSDRMLGSYSFGDDDLGSIFPPLVARAIETIGGFSTLRELARGYYGGNKTGSDRKAFIDQYTPAYERAMQEAMHPPALRRQLDNAERHLGADTIKMIESAKDAREEQRQLWNGIIFRQRNLIRESKNEES